MQLIKGKNKRINEQMNEEVRKLLPIAYCLLPIACLQPLRLPGPQTSDLKPLLQAGGHFLLKQLCLLTRHPGKIFGAVSIYYSS
jgi:hypothetical protein